MKIYTTYKVKIKRYSAIFKETVLIYRKAVDFFIEVCLLEWEKISEIAGSKAKMSFVEKLCHRTEKNPQVKYDFSEDFYKFPSYLRRAAIMEAIGKVSSYHSNMKNWQEEKKGKKPGKPKAGHVFPAMYRKGMYERIGTYTARIKVFTRNTWDWLEVELKKSDTDYIERHCTDRMICVPTLRKRGREWFLDFSFEEKVGLSDTDISRRIAISVDLGINNACTCCAMAPDGTVLGRHFLKLPREKDSLEHALNRIKKAQQMGARKTPRLWAKANGINKDIAVKTSAFIMEAAELYDTDVIVFEHLDLEGKKRGNKKQRLHMWKARYVQQMVSNKAHRKGIRISTVNAWGTSTLAYDGSGRVERGRYLQDGIERYNYSICVFPTGKTYHCDLNAGYNIGARYFIREILKSLPETARLQLEAKVPEACKRSTCTLSTLISLYAELAA